MARITKLKLDSDQQKLQCSGNWTIPYLGRLEILVNQIELPHSTPLAIDCTAIEQMDTSGALVLQRVINKANANSNQVDLTGLSEKYQQLIQLVKRSGELHEPKPAVNRSWLYSLGRMGTEKVFQFSAFLSFIGELAVDSLSKLPTQRNPQWQSLLYNVEEHGYRALPIIGLLSFLVGVVLAYQMGLQLKDYGANIFIVNILGVTILREFAPFLTAIILAGRTASSFTAQLGLMKINEEIDALKTLGMSPFKRLVVPKILAMMIVMPLLTVWAAIFGILGGMVMANIMLDINYYDFILRFEKVIPLKTYLIGLSKTPVFALIIALIGCFQGWRSGFSAESVGHQTTKSVVQSLFIIIVFDALFSIYFSWTDI